MPKGDVPLVDRLIDEISEIRSDSAHHADDVETRITSALHELVKALNGAKVLRTVLADADVSGENGGEMYVALRALREAPAIRRASRPERAARLPEPVPAGLSL